MSWTADSTQITADQTCWTADGGNRCLRGGVGGDGDGKRHLTGQTVLPDRSEAVRKKAEDELRLRQGIETAYYGKSELPEDIEVAIEIMPTGDLEAIVRDDDALAVVVILLLA